MHMIDKLGDISKEEFAMQVSIKDAEKLIEDSNAAIEQATKKLNQTKEETRRLKRKKIKLYYEALLVIVKAHKGPTEGKEWEDFVESIEILTCSEQNYEIHESLYGSTSYKKEVLLTEIEGKINSYS